MGEDLDGFGVTVVVEDHAHEVDVGVADRLRVEKVVWEGLDPVADRLRLRVAEIRAVGDHVGHVLCDEPETGEGFCERDADAAWGAADLGAAGGLAVACAYADTYIILWG